MERDNKIESFICKSGRAPLFCPMNINSLRTCTQLSCQGWYTVFSWSPLLIPVLFSPVAFSFFFLNLDGKMGGRGPGNEPAGLLPPKQSTHCVSIFTQIP